MRAADPDAGLAVGLGTERHGRIERFGRPWPQGRLFGLGHRADRGQPAVDVASVVGGIGRGEERVERGQRGNPRHRHEMPSPEAPDLALDAALLVGTPLARFTETRRSHSGSAGP